MKMQDDEIIQAFIAESREHLENIEQELLDLEDKAANPDPELVNRIFRAAHSIKGGAGFLGLTNIRNLSHGMESLLSLVRKGQRRPTSAMIDALLRAADQLKSLLNDITASEAISVQAELDALDQIIGLDEKPGTDQASQVNPIETAPAMGLPFEFDLSGINGEAVSTGTINVYLLELNFPTDDMTWDLFLGELKQWGKILTWQHISGSKADESDRISRVLLESTLSAEQFDNTLTNFDRKVYHLNQKMKFHLVTPHIGEMNSSSNQLESVVEPEHSSFELEPENDMQRVSGTDSKQANRPMASDSTIRVNVALINNLLRLAGELVLCRNQLLQLQTGQKTQMPDQVVQKVDQLTSRLHETIMQTRMQPIGNLFRKYPRQIRDLANSMGKQIRLELNGERVELDRTMLESLSDPLTHIIRNSADHGIEKPEVRLRLGKKTEGSIRLEAKHDSGQIIIAVTDDGKGMNPVRIAEAAVEKGLISAEKARVISDKEKLSLIFAPGFSTVDTPTEVSGRGVGMDVVRTNINKLGGQISLHSEPNMGTRILIKLPLTLTIIPSLIVRVEGERFAIPQTNLKELIRISPGKVQEKIEMIGESVVVRLRDNFLPLIRLADILNITRTYIDPISGERKPDRRNNIADRRSKRNPFHWDEEPISEDPVPTDLEKRSQNKDRRAARRSAFNVVIVTTGVLDYGIIVDELLDPEEIVVKPLSRFFQHSGCFSGATIMGDGKPALILDVISLAQLSEISSVDGTGRASEIRDNAEALRLRNTRRSILIFRGSEREVFAVPLSYVVRIERIHMLDVQRLNQYKAVNLNGTILPVYALSDLINVDPIHSTGEIFAVIIAAQQETGLLALRPLDVIEISGEVQPFGSRISGIIGTLVHRKEQIHLLDIAHIFKPQTEEDLSGQTQTQAPIQPTILIVEDSNFFRSRVKTMLEDEGFDILEASDGQQACEIIEKEIGKIKLIVTDLQMPVMDGFELIRRVKSDPGTQHIPMIALSTLADDDDLKKASTAGVNDYCIKLDQTILLKAISKQLQQMESSGGVK